MTRLPPLARLVSTLIPAADRQAIVGDLLEDARWRGLCGPRLAWDLAGSCLAIGSGLAVDRVRAGMTLPPARELAAGVVMDSGRALRGVLDAPRSMLLRVAAFCATVTLLAFSVEILVAALMAAAGLRL